MLLLSIAEDGVRAYEQKDTQTIDSIKTRDHSVNTLVSYCLRTLNKRGSIHNALHLHTLLVLLEQLGDSYSRMYFDVKAINKTTLRHAKETATLLRAFYELYYKFDKKKASELKNKRDHIRKTIDLELAKITNKHDLLALFHIRRIADLIVDVEKFQIAMQI